MISYYELLKMIDRNDIPEQLIVRLGGCSSRIFNAEYDGETFSHYYLQGEANEDYHHYLSECYLESMMFKKTITIVNEKLEKIDLYDCFETMEIDTSGRLDYNFKCISDIINKIVDKLNKEEE